MKLLFCLILIFSGSISINAQNTDSVVLDKRYKSAYAFISNPKNLKKSNSFFRKVSKKNYPPNIFYDIYPISLMMLNEAAIRDVIKPDTVAENKIGEFIIWYDRNNYFDTVRYFSSCDFKKNDQSQLYVVFSKLKDDYLLAELHIDYYGNRPSNYQSLSKIGSYFKLLFQFDENGEVKKFFCNEVYQ